MKKTTASKKLSQKIKTASVKLKLMREQLKKLAVEEKNGNDKVKKVKKRKSKTASKAATTQATKKRRGRPPKE